MLRVLIPAQILGYPLQLQARAAHDLLPRFSVCLEFLDMWSNRFGLRLHLFVSRFQDKLNRYQPIPGSRRVTTGFQLVDRNNRGTKVSARGSVSLRALRSGGLPSTRRSWEPVVYLCCVVVPIGPSLSGRIRLKADAQARGCPGSRGIGIFRFWKKSP